MKDLLDKLSSYNLFNYLLPGTLFVAAAEQVTAWRFTQANIVVQLFLYYFIGLVISRFGSLVLEPLFKRTKFVSFAPYKDYIRACGQDSKVELLSEQNNMFRTLCALFVVLPAFKLADVVALNYQIGERTGFLLLFALLFVVFALAYRKQTRYIQQRVKHQSQ